MLYFIVLIGLYADNISKAEEYKQIANSTYTNDFEGSLNYINESIKLNSNDVASYTVRGMIHDYWGIKLKNKEYRALAWDDYSYAIKKFEDGKFKVTNRTIANIYIMRALISLSGKSYDQAFADYEISCKLDKNNCAEFEEMKQLIYSN